MSAYFNTIGTVSPEILSRTITLGLGKNRQDMEWKNQSASVQDLIGLFASFATGPKDGSCILQGELVGPRRMAKAMSVNHILAIDLDTGVSLEEVGTRIVKEDLFAIIYTTHSFGKSETDIPEDKFLGWMKGEGRAVPIEGSDRLSLALADYLCIDRRYHDDVLKSYTYMGRSLKEGGMKYTIKHMPMPRLRCIFLLDTPFSFTVGGSQRERMEEWKKVYADTCNWLGVTFDTSCTDPSRLFYTPRVPRGAEFGENKHEILVFAGKALKLSDAPNAVRLEASGPVPIEQAFQKTVVDGAAHEFKTKDLLRFVTKAKDFDIVRFMEAVAPDDRRGYSRDPDKSEWCCPNDDGHTEANPDDRAFYVEVTETGWKARCLHDSCKRESGDDRLWYLDRLCMKYGIEDAAELYPWSASGVAQQAEAAESLSSSEESGKVAEMVAELSKDSPVEDVKKILKILSMTDDPLIREATLTHIQRQTKRLITTSTMRDMLTLYRQEQRASLGQAEENSKPIDSRPIEPVNLEDANSVWSHWGYRKQCEVLQVLVRKANDKNPKLFIDSNNLPVFVVDAKTGARLIDADAKTVPPYFTETVKYLSTDKLTGETLEERVSVGLIQDFVYAHAPVWPFLDRIVHTPIVAPSGEQIIEKGYVPELGLYLDPTASFEDLPNVVSEDDVATAVCTLLEPLRDFPFSDAFNGEDFEPIRRHDVDEDGHPLPNLKRGRSSRANCLAFLMQPFVRHLIDGPCPMYEVKKPVAGTGAGYLVDVAFLISQGHRAIVQTMSHNDEEFRKAITAVLRDGSPIIFIDNINRKVTSGDLAAALTSGTWKDRILGETKTTTIPIKNTWVLAGNGLELTSELRRRVVPILLDANENRPAFDRPKAFFKYNPLQEIVLKQRANLVWAINTLVKHWIQKGSPDGSMTMNSFDNYARVMGGILECAGIEGFLDNVGKYLEHADEDSSVEKLVAEEIFSVYQFGEFNASDAVICAVDPMTNQLNGDIPVQRIGTEHNVKGFSRWMSKTILNNTFNFPTAKDGEVVKVKLLMKAGRNGKIFRFSPIHT